MVRYSSAMAKIQLWGRGRKQRLVPAIPIPRLRRKANATLTKLLHRFCACARVCLLDCLLFCSYACVFCKPARFENRGMGEAASVFSFGCYGCFLSLSFFSPLHDRDATRPTRKQNSAATTEERERSENSAAKGGSKGSPSPPPSLPRRPSQRQEKEKTVSELPHTVFPSFVASPV
jgi:hypothetical protein